MSSSFLCSESFLYVGSSVPKLDLLQMVFWNESTFILSVFCRNSHIFKRSLLSAQNKLRFVCLFDLLIYSYLGQLNLGFLPKKKKKVEDRGYFWFLSYYRFNVQVFPCIKNKILWLFLNLYVRVRSKEKQFKEYLSIN